MPRCISFGLRFLHQNIPGISNLEHPTKSEYSAQLRQGWDAVGFSFYLEETNRAGLYAHYIVGLPSETPESIAEDLRTLASLEREVTQITIVTPHPQTEM